MLGGVSYGEWVGGVFVHLHLAIGGNVGECVENVGDLVRGELLGLVVGAVDTPEMVS